MALDLSKVAILEKNKLASDGAWLVLLEIQLDSTTSIRVVRNTENIDWGGHTWMAFPFELDEMSSNAKGELPVVPVRVSNITRTLQQYLEQFNGGVGATVVLRVVHSQHLNESFSELEEVFTVQHVSADSNWVVFELGGDTPTMLRYPFRRVLKDYCPFVYRGIECGADSGQLTCNKTLKQCRERNNSVRFGGEPSIPQGGIYASN